MNWYRNGHAVPVLSLAFILDVAFHVSFLGWLCNWDRFVRSHCGHLRFHGVQLWIGPKTGLSFFPGGCLVGNPAPCCGCELQPILPIIVPLDLFTASVGSVRKVRQHPKCTPSSSCISSHVYSAAPFAVCPFPNPTPARPVLLESEIHPTPSRPPGV